MLLPRLLVLTLALAAGACTAYQTRVTYQYGAPPVPPPPGSIFIEPSGQTDGNFAEFATDSYVWLDRLGYGKATSKDAADYVMQLAYGTITGVLQHSEVVDDTDAQGNVISSHVEYTQETVTDRRLHLVMSRAAKSAESVPPTILDIVVAAPGGNTVARAHRFAPMPSLQQSCAI